MSIYWVIVIAVIVLGLILPQSGAQKKTYIILMAILHAFVCGFKYMYLTGDLRKYAANYYSYLNADWFSKGIWNGGKNAGFYLLEKLLSTITDGEFQIFLIVLAVITEIAVAVLVYQYSPKPWMSYLVWDCLAFYITYGFSAIKQGLAMAILMFAMIGILEKNPKKFLFFTLLAGFCHMPALAFLPAYWIGRRRISMQTILAYVFAAIVIFVFRSWVVQFVSSLYYEADTFTVYSSDVGGRFWVIVLMLATGVLLKGFREKNFECLFNMVVVAAIFQMFAGYDNVFTRFSDYYLQFTVLYLPMIFYETEDTKAPVNERHLAPVLQFNARSWRIIIFVFVLILIWWYDKTCLGVKISFASDNYLNFRFMWDV